VGLLYDRPVVVVVSGVGVGRGGERSALSCSRSPQPAAAPLGSWTRVCCGGDRRSTATAAVLLGAAGGCGAVAAAAAAAAVTFQFSSQFDKRAS